jgi:serine/threonine protein kinase
MGDNLIVGGQLGSYLIESVIGRGGMSVVYRAQHLRLGTPVALKVLAPELSSADAFRERFLREAKMAAAIDHPNVIPIYDTGIHGDSLYIVMRYVSGGDLKALLKREGPLNPSRAIALLAPIAGALDAAHARGLVHRDVKPANILIEHPAGADFEQVFLSDFGITKHSSSVSGLTGTGALVGTIDYMAPEQIEGREVGPQTDIYALGCVFYQCVTGRVPFDRDSDAAVLWAHMREGILPPSSVRAELPPAFDSVIETALAKDPAERFQSCAELVAAGATALDATGTVRVELASLGSPTIDVPTPTSPGRGIARPEQIGAPAGAAQAVAGARRDSSAPRQADARRRRRWLLWAGAAGLVAAAFAAGAALFSKSSSTPPARPPLKSKTVPVSQKFPAKLKPVPTNHVTGYGSATISLVGDVATVSIQTHGLLNGAPHLMHLHAGALGVCPTAAAARLHNGHLTISTSNGAASYGPPVASLTTSGDTSPASILAFNRYPTAGDIRYQRKFTLPAQVVAYIRKDDAVVVIHGIDYDGSGIYDGVLGTSDLSSKVSEEATAPALCGELRPAPAHAKVASAATVTSAAAAAPPAAHEADAVVYTAALDAEPAADDWLCGGSGG